MVVEQGVNGTLNFSEEMQWLEQPVQGFLSALPEIIGAILILLVGWIAGRIIGSSVQSLVEKLKLDGYVHSTPLGKAMGDTERGVARALGKIAKWFVYAIAVLAAASVLDIAVLSQWISRAISYLPSFVGGLLVIILGFVLADFIGDMIMHTEAATRSRYTSWFADGVRIFLYFLAVTIGLDTMGINVQLLYIFAQAAAWGVAIGLALAIGIGFGWGMKDYVSENIDSWAHRTKEETSRS